MNTKRIIVLSTSLLAMAAVSIVIWEVTLKFSLERRIIPAYPDKYASLRQIMDYYRDELAKQGLHVEIRVLNRSCYDEPRVVRGIEGNGYLFLHRVSDAFDTRYRCGVGRVILVGGVGSKDERDGRKPLGGKPAH
jgi:hypothetical protein